ncbi:structural maintenance of chromosomes 5 smc5 [Diplodia corticola]|uniref:Structural maintenance of chromosomes protein 5 n=1 Tax=Diplodia corticola TaxID=236234 RepID=A0A1J9R5P2_9PEZI|nr:structural maintenance of chromosomes 5 smc5 [Diplodia corticola]OJD35538.1 structural maintenance of chromosomes 5 smc5 [Diplodia corticola]
MARRRLSSELDEDEDGNDSYVSQTQRSAKRPRTDDDVSEASDDPVLPDSYRSQPRRGGSSSDDLVPLKHQPGSIVRVKLTNFVTYTSAEFQLGPSLNMIIGPNGTGKSTLVCAICLGLGWGPQHLGRAKELGEFVKHGAREAEIEIELSGGPQTRDRNPIIRRLIRREGNKSSFVLNEQQTTHKEIIRLCKSFSIQIDNLCQFLPQDRVVEFAALSPVQLLEQTQRAAAPDYMNDWHDQLKAMRNEQKTKTATRDNKHEFLRGLQNKHNLQRADVERMQERQALTDKLQAYQNIRPFVQYRTAQATFKEAKKNFNDARLELRELQLREQPTLDALRRKDEYRNQVEQVVRQRTKLVERMERNAETVRQRMDSMQAEINDKDTSKNAEKNANKDRARQRDSLKREIMTITEKMNKGTPEFDAAAFNERSREKQRASRELHIENQDLNRQRDEILQRIRRLDAQKQEVERDVQSLRSQAGQQSNRLKKFSMDTWKAWDWVQKNRDQLTGEVFGPPIVSCSVTDHRFSDAIESCLQKGDFLAFTVSNRRDFATLSKTFQRMGLNETHIKEAIRPRDSWKPLMSSDGLRQYGLSGWIIDYLSGPDPVLSTLCDSLRLHQCAVTLQNHSDEQFERLKASPIQRWVAGQRTYQVSRRREYGDQAVSVTSKPIRRSGVWTDQPVDMSVEREHQSKIREIGHDIHDLNQAVAELTEKIRANKETISQLEREKRDIDEQKHELQRLRGEFEGLQTRKDTCEINLAQTTEALNKMAQRLETIDAETDELILKKGQLAIDYANSVKSLLELHHGVYEAEIVLAEAKSECQICDEQSKAIKRDIADRETNMRRLKAESDQCKKAAQRLSEEVSRINDMRSDEEAALVEHIETVISLEDLEAEIVIFQSRLTLLHGGDPNAIRDFEKRAKLIEETEQRLRGLDDELQELQDRIEGVKSQWEPELDGLVRQISLDFSNNFSKIGCAGQVSIYKAEDFSEWAIQIQVKFREQEQLSILDSHRQSGGERAVSTIFYLMALQSLARSPFRVVDEINQGMDPRNERMVHERMVDIACQEHTAQYFLITPKLLHGLKFHPRMTVHCIASGEYMPSDYRELDFKALVEVALRVKGKA